MKSGKEGFTPYLKLTFLIGFGFFTMGLMDPLYDTYVPIFLGGILKTMHIDSNALIGFIMTFDNIMAVILIPLVSLWSDNTRTRFGRRIPYIATLLPLSALFFALIPYAAEAAPAGRALTLLLVVIALLNIVKQSARGPVVALMPDIIPGNYRSEANGIINTMGAIGGILGTIGLSRLLEVDLVLPLIGSTKGKLPFSVAGLFVLLAAILVSVFIKERNTSEKVAEERVPFLSSLKAIAGGEDKSALWILISLFLWFFGYQGIVPFVGKLSKEVLNASPTNVALPAGMVGIAQALFAIPAGYFAHRFGRKRAIRMSLIVLAVILCLASFVIGPLGTGVGPGTRFLLFLCLMFAYGIFWIVIITNSFPMLWQMASYGTIGVYTGMYYTFSQAAAITAPPLTGQLSDKFGYQSIFLFAACCMLGAFFCMGLVKKGEPGQNAAEVQRKA